MPEVSLIPKEYKEKKFAFGVIFSKIGILAVVLVVFSLLVYGGLFFYKKSLSKELNELQVQIIEINEQRDEEFEKKVRSLDGALKSLKILLKNHLYWSNLFSKLEDLIVPWVSFSAFSGAIDKDGAVNLGLSGKTMGYTYLAKQMVSFSQDKLVSDIKISEITLGTEGGIEFGLDVTFEKDILLK